MRPREVLRVIIASGSGRVGLALLSLLVLVSVSVPFFYPLDFGLRFWNNPVVWADNPKAAPPIWTALFNHDQPRHRAFTATAPASISPDGGIETRTYPFSFDYRAQQPPTFLSFTLGRVTYHGRPPVVTVTLTRPDSREATLYQEVVRGPRPGETPPIIRYAEAPQRTFLSGEPSAVAAAADFLGREFHVQTSAQEMQGRLEEALFTTPSEAGGAAVPLQGAYALTVRVLAYDPRDTVESVTVVVGGAIYGLMGTDAQGRDLATGLLFGFPVALLIGITTSVGATAIGTFFGILSGFQGGKTDTAIQRISDILTNVPLLPILIFLIFVLGQRLWLVMAILVAFGWPGLTIVLRSMVLQIRSGQLVEATQALGASRWRVMFRHILFQVAPFVIAQMIFFTPAAILAEAGLSFLGLGDPSLPTWGQILEQGFRTGAVYVGYWWWVLPPGFLIVLTAMAFVLLSLSLEPVLNPRLRRSAP